MKGTADRILLSSLAGLLMVGCTGPSAYERVFNDKQSINARTYPVDSKICWLAVNRATLGLRFAVDQQDQEKGSLQASRYFQEGKRTTTVVLHVNLEPEGEHKTTVYANAVEMSERVFTRSHTRFFLAVIPLPGGGGLEANRVKERERTVNDKRFYENFFAAIDKELHTVETSSHDAS